MQPYVGLLTYSHFMLDDLGNSKRSDK